MSELEQLQQAISAIESQRSFLGDAVVDAALAPMRAKLVDLQAASQAEPQRKLATLLFMDIAGHTALTRNLDPEELIEVVDQPLARLASQVTRLGGRVVRFQGDGFKAVFGLPTSNENDPENAVRAGLEIQAAAGEIAGQLERERGMKGFAVRVGIATGLVLGGGGTEGDGAVKGEAVNLAARMESVAQPGTVLIAQSTYQHVRNEFELKPLDPIQAKGFSEPVQVYQVLAAKPHTFRTHRMGVEGVQTRMVGRAGELKVLQDLFSAMLKSSQRQFVNIVGEPGLGKSRLLYEFESWVNAQPAQVHIYRGRARLETRRLPYGLVRDLFTTEFQIQDSDREADAIQKLENGIRQASGSEQAEWAAFIGHLIGLDYSSSPQLRGILGDAQQIRDQAFFSALQFFKTVFQRQPSLVLLEDIHWADEGSLDFIELLSQASLEYPLMIVCLTRDTLYEARPTWGAEGAATRIDLMPLTVEDSEHLVEDILRNVPEIPESIHDLIVSRAEGNPFYVEEVIKMLIDDGVIVTGSDHWEVRKERFVEGKIPQTLTGVLQARLDGLPANERKALQRASVAGRVFWDDLISRMMDSNEAGEPGKLNETTSVLEHLRKRELVYQKDPSKFNGTSEYLFKHAVLRDVTYERVLKVMRRAYHRQVAEWLSEHIGERVGEYAGRIGEHYEQSGEASEAAEWYARAGKQAQDTYASEMAEEYYQKALSLWQQVILLSPEQRSLRLEVMQGLGQVLDWLGQYAESIEVYKGMVGAAQAMGDLLKQARAWHGVAEAQMHRGEVRSAIQSAAQEQALAIAAGAQLEMAKALWMKAWGTFRLGDMENALSLAEQVSALSFNLQDNDQMANSYNLLGVLASTSGRYLEAADHFERALDIFQSVGNRRRAMPLMNNLGVILESRGDYHAARQRYQEALEVSREIGNRDGEMVYLSNLGGIKVRLGLFSAAEADLRQVISMAGSEGLDVLSTTYGFLAEACLGQARTGEALENVQQAFLLARQMESQGDLGAAWRVLGKIATFLREPVSIKVSSDEQTRNISADTCFAESENVFIEIGREEERARTLRAWARYRFQSGDDLGGTRLWHQAKAIFAQLGAQAEVDRMEDIYAQKMDRADQPDPGAGFRN